MCTEALNWKIVLGAKNLVLMNKNELFLSLSCKCPPMFDGPECQQTKHSFGGQGYAWFPPIKPCFQSHISVEFLAESANGLLLYNGPLGLAHSGEQEDFIALGGFIIVDLGGKSANCLY